jgi:hypothetical protein
VNRELEQSKEEINNTLKTIESSFDRELEEANRNITVKLEKSIESSVDRIESKRIDYSKLF